MPCILFVTGFHPATRARDLALEFERYGPLIRCDVPAPRNPNAASNAYAFVEFRAARDAEDAYYDMHGRTFERSRLSIQWAKSPPGRRADRRQPPRRDSGDHPRVRGDRERSRSPRRDYGSRRNERRRSRTPDRRYADRKGRSDADGELGRDGETGGDGERGRDTDEGRDRNEERARTPPLGPDEVSTSHKEKESNAQSPPYEH